MPKNNKSKNEPQKSNFIEYLLMIAAGTGLLCYSPTAAKVQEETIKELNNRPIAKKVVSLNVAMHYVRDANYYLRPKSSYGFPRQKEALKSLREADSRLDDWRSDEEIKSVDDMIRKAEGNLVKKGFLMEAGEYKENTHEIDQIKTTGFRMLKLLKEEEGRLTPQERVRSRAYLLCVVTGYIMIGYSVFSFILDLYKLYKVTAQNYWLQPVDKRRHLSHENPPFKESARQTPPFRAE